MPHSETSKSGALPSARTAWIAAGILAALVAALGINLQNQRRQAAEAQARAQRQQEEAERALVTAQQANEIAQKQQADLARARQEAGENRQASKDAIESLRAEAASNAENAQRLEEQLKKAVEDSRRAETARVSALGDARQIVDPLQFELAERAFDADNANRGVAILADLVRRSPDNAAAVTRLISALTDRSFALTLHPPIPAAPNSEAMALSQDGTRIALIAPSPAGSTTAHVRNLNTPGLQPVTLNHSNRIEHLAFSPDGTKVAVCANELKSVEQGGRTAILPAGGAATGKPVAGPLRHEVGVWSSSFNPAGNRILTVGGDRAARIWDAASGAVAARPLVHPAPIDRAFFSPDGSLIATVSGRFVHTWNAQTGDGPLASLEHAGMVLATQFTIDSKLLVAFPSDDKAVVWDPRSGQTKLSAPFALPNIAATAGVGISPDGQRIAAAHNSGGAAVWDAFSGQLVTAEPRHELPVNRLEFSPNGRLLATASVDGTARLWDAHLGFPKGEAIPNLSWPFRLRFSPRGDRLVVLRGAGGVEIRTTAPGAARPLMLLSTSPLVSATFSADGANVIATNANDVGFVWDARSGRRASLAVVAWETSNDRAAVRLSPPNTAILTRPSGGGTTRVALSIDAADPLRSAVVSRDGSRILALMDGRETDATASPVGGALQAFDSSGRALTRRLVHPFPIASAVVSPDNRLLATACLDRQARIFEIGPQARQLLLPHLDPVLKVLFSPEGGRLLTLTVENDLRVWDIASGQPVSEIKQQFGDILNLEFNATGDPPGPLRIGCPTLPNGPPARSPMEQARDRRPPQQIRPPHRCSSGSAPMPGPTPSTPIGQPGF